MDLHNNMELLFITYVINFGQERSLRDYRPGRFRCLAVLISVEAGQHRNLA